MFWIESAGFAIANLNRFRLFATCFGTGTLHVGDNATVFGIAEIIASQENDVSLFQLLDLSGIFSCRIINAAGSLGLIFANSVFTEDGRATRQYFDLPVVQLIGKSGRNIW
ncbi:hypothetical protein BHQ29_09145 [Pseudomonas sp. LPH1]|nr:hypothetical protein BHQ29_09145 [Pseudomonas sp. LPH1]